MKPHIDSQRLEKRRVERVARKLPVELGRGTGLTKDISSSGLFLELDVTEGLRIPMSFAVAVETPTGRMTLRCEGEIVRVEPKKRTVGLAIRITDSKLVEI